MFGSGSLAFLAGGAGGRGAGGGGAGGDGFVIRIRVAFCVGVRGGEMRWDETRARV